MPLAQRQSHVLGVDIGGTKIAAGLVTFPEGRLLAGQVIATRPNRPGADILADVHSLATNLAAASSKNVSGLGLSLCELVSPNGEIQSAATLPWTSAQVKRRLARFAPITIEADVRAAARAEAMFGAGAQCRNFLFVTVGTGISCCLVLEGQPYAGTRGATGTMASGIYKQRCQECGHVQERSLEDVASGRGLVAQFERAGGRVTTAEELFTLDNYAAMEVLEEGGEALGQTVALLIDVLDPEAVIVGGGLGLAGKIYWKALLSSTRRAIWSQVSRRIPILRARTGQNAGVIGAAASAWVRPKGPA